MAKNIEINIATSDSSYEVLYPKTSYSNMSDTLDITNTSGNLPANRLNAGTLTGSFTFNNTVTGVTPTNSSHLTTKNYVDNLTLLSKSGTYIGTGVSDLNTTLVTINIGFKPHFFGIMSNTTFNPFSELRTAYANGTWPYRIVYNSTAFFFNLNEGTKASCQVIVATGGKNGQDNLQFTINSTSVSWLSNYHEGDGTSDVHITGPKLNQSKRYNWFACRFR